MKQPSLVCVLLAFITEALTVLFFPASHASYASAYYYFLSSHCCSLKPTAFIFPFPLWRFPHLPAAHCFCFPFIFPETSLAECIFFFHDAKTLRGSLYWCIYPHQKDNILFWGCVLSSCHQLVGKQNKTKENTSVCTLESLQWASVQNSSVGLLERAQLHDSVPIVKVRWLFNKEIHFQAIASLSRKWVDIWVERLRMEI